MFRVFVLAAVFLGIGATDLLAQPNLSQIKSTADGYELTGRGFGRDKAKVQVFEGMTQVASAAIMSVADDLIVVRSKPNGMVQHRVVVGGQSSTMNFMHAAQQAAARPALTPAQSAAGGALPRPRAAVPSLTQTVSTGPLSMTGRGGTAGASAGASRPTLTQTVTTQALAMTGRGGAVGATAPALAPSLTQTVTTGPLNMTGSQ